VTKLEIRSIQHRRQISLQERTIQRRDARLQRCDKSVVVRHPRPSRTAADEIA
jgi:hypothetical protein